MLLLLFVCDAFWVDHILREKIWANHLPPALKLAPDVDLKLLAMKYELTGGFIKNGTLPLFGSGAAVTPNDQCVCALSL